MSIETRKQKAQKAKAARAAKKIQTYSVHGRSETKVNEIGITISSKITTRRWYARRRCILIKGENGRRYRVISSNSPTMKKDTRSGGPKSKIPRGC